MGILEPFVLFVLVAVLVSGSLVALVGWRGRRIDNHPVCRRCGFDVSGAPLSKRCSECGADLAQLHATRIGNRERRPRAIAVGIVLMAPPLLLLACFVYVQAAGINLQSHKPVWMLTRELSWTDAGTREMALTELERRTRDDELSDPETSHVIEWVLQRQAEDDLPWEQRWGGLVELSRTNGRLSDERWRRFMLQGLGLHLAVRPAVRKGEPLAVSVRALPRTGPGVKLLALLEWEEASVEGWSLFTPEGPVFYEASADGWRCKDYRSWERWDALPTDGFAIGELDLHLRVRVRVGAHPGALSPTAVPLEPAASATFVFRKTTQILPSDSPAP